jgi:20S proteasome subunit alpha 5
MTVESTTQAICDLALRFGEGEEESMVSIYCYYYQNTTLPLEFLISTYLLLQSRPFGVSLLIAGHDENGPSL